MDVLVNFYFKLKLYFKLKFYFKLKLYFNILGFKFIIMFIIPDPDQFLDAVFFVDPVTNTIDDSLLMCVSKDPLNADRYSRYLQVRSSVSTPRVDDETNFDLCLPRSVQSLSEHQAFNEELSSFIRSLMIHVPVGGSSSESHEPSPSETPGSSPSDNS